MTESTPSSELEVLPPEALRPEDRALVDRYMALHPGGGVLANVLVGEQPGDLRPLFVSQGKLNILRVIKLQYSNDFLQRVLSVFQSSAEEFGLSSFGASAAVFWLSRPYCSETLNHSDMQRNLEGGQQLREALCETLFQLDRLHKAGAFHGHIQLSNLALEAGSCLLLDPLCYAAGYELHEENIRALQQRDWKDLCKTMIELGPYVVHENEKRELEQLKELNLESIVALLYPNQQQGPIIKSAGAMGSGKVLSGLPSSVSQGAQNQAISEQKTDADLAGVAEDNGVAQDDENSAMRRSKPNEDVPYYRRSPRPLDEVIDLEATMAPPEPFFESEEQAEISAEGRGDDPEPGEGTSAPLEDLYKSKPKSKSKKQKSSKTVEDELPFDAPQLSTHSLTNYIVPLAALMMMLMLGLLLYRAKIDGPAVQTVDIPIEKYWESGQREFMSQVAVAAVKNGDDLARLTIIRSLSSDSPPAFVESQLLQTALHPAWEAELTEQDRIIALSLALAPILPRDVSFDFDLREAHAGVLVSILGTLPEDRTPRWAAEISMDPFLRLPQGYGALFSGLHSQGVNSVDQQAFLGLCRILSGNATADALSAVLAAFGAVEEQSQFLQALTALLGNQRPKDLNLLFSSLRASTGELASRARWFNDIDQDLVAWNQTPVEQRLALTTGFDLTKKLANRFVIDLLSFPSRNMKRTASVEMTKRSKQPVLASLLPFLAMGQHRFSRLQVFYLVNALIASKNLRPSLITDWFESKPDPAGVAELLLELRGSDPDNSFSFAASRYLARSDWLATVAQLEKLLSHPEKLARALAYSQLDVEVAEQRQLMENALKVEPSKKLREKLQERLELYRSQSDS